MLYKICSNWLICTHINKQHANIWKWKLYMNRCSKSVKFTWQLTTCSHNMNTCKHVATNIIHWSMQWICTIYMPTDWNVHKATSTYGYYRCTDQKTSIVVAKWYIIVVLLTGMCEMYIQMRIIVQWTSWQCIRNKHHSPFLMTWAWDFGRNCEKLW